MYLGSTITHYMNGKLYVTIDNYMHMICAYLTCMIQPSHFHIIYIIYVEGTEVSLWWIQLQTQRNSMLLCCNLMSLSTKKLWWPSLLAQVCIIVCLVGCGLCDLQLAPVLMIYDFLNCNLCQLRVLLSSGSPHHRPCMTLAEHEEGLFSCNMYAVLQLHCSWWECKKFTQVGGYFHVISLRLPCDTDAQP